MAEGKNGAAAPTKPGILRLSNSHTTGARGASPTVMDYRRRASSSEVAANSMLDDIDTHSSADGGPRNLTGDSAATDAATITSLPSVKWALPAAVNTDDEDVINSIERLLQESELNERQYRTTPSIVKHRVKSLRLNERLSSATARESASALNSAQQHNNDVWWTPQQPSPNSNHNNDSNNGLNAGALPTSFATLFNLPDYSGDNHSEDEDYSISVSAVMQRRASTKAGQRKYKTSARRTSSPMGHAIMLSAMTPSNAPAAAAAASLRSSVDVASVSASVASRRRSSVFTTSSGEAPSYGEGGNTNTRHDSTKEQIFENIRLHKEVLQSVKLQPWSMRRKLRLVRQAKEYVARHEGALQERFAMSRSTKDLWARFKIMLAYRWQHLKREVANLSTVLIPWELRIKEIESHFGSVVASYFTFLRWLFWVNIVIVLALGIFVVVPEFLATQWPPQQEDLRKNMLPAEMANATRLISIWDFEGFLKYSPLFYGYYSDFSGASRFHYDLPLAYFLTGLVVYIYSFWATLRKMAENSRMSKLSSKDDECVFSWKVFTGWDYMIGHAETAHNRIASVVLGFKEALLEEAEKKKDKRNWKIIVLRVIVNLLVVGLLCVSAYAVVAVVHRSAEEGANNSYWRRNEITVVITAISFFFPMFFEGLGFLESYHPRKQLRMQLARIMALNLLNLYALIFALFVKIGAMNKQLLCLHQNITQSRDMQEAAELAELNNPGGTASTTYMWTDDEYNDTSTIGGDATVTTAVTTAMSMMAEVTTQVFSSFDSTSSKDWMDGSTTVETMLETVTVCVRKLVNCTQPTTPMPVLVVLATMLSTMFPNGSTTEMGGNITVEADAMEEFGDWNGNHTTVMPSFDMFENMNGTAESNETDIFVNYPDYNETIYNRQIRELFEQFYLNQSDIDAISQILPFSNDTILDLLSSRNATNDTNAIEGLMDEFRAYTENAATELQEEECYVTECHEEIVTESPESRSTPDFVTEIPTTIANEADTTSDNNDDISSTTEIPTEATSYSEDPSSSPYTIDYESTTGTVTSSTVSSETYFPFSPVPNPHVSLTHFIMNMNTQEQLVLRKLCWETMFGQELVKLTVMDLVATITSTLFMDFFRALFVRFFNKFWCWDLEKRYPKYGDFKIAENILHLVNNQGQVWMGMFFSPGLAILNLLKLVIIMYLRSWAVLTCNVPHEVVFRASRSNNFYLMLLLTMLFLCVLPVGYAIVWINPSWHCGPFSKYERIYLIFTTKLRAVLPVQLRPQLEYIASPSTVIPLLLLLVLIIYYLLSLTGALRAANEDLRFQLRRERTEGRKKMLRLPKQEDDANTAGNVMDRWRKVLEASSPVSPSVAGAPGGGIGNAQPIDDDEALKNNARKEFLARLMKKALRKGSNTSDDDSHPMGVVDDETDTDQHESLPHDMEGASQVRPTLPALKRPPSIKKTPHHRLLATHSPNDPKKASTKNVPTAVREKPKSGAPSFRDLIGKSASQNKNKKVVPTPKPAKAPSAAAPSEAERAPSAELASAAPAVSRSLATAPAAKTKASSSSRFKIEKVVETKNKKHNDDFDDEDDDGNLKEVPPSRVVRERRRSLLRQGKLPETTGHNGSPTENIPLAVRCSYAVINEKSPAAQRRRIVSNHYTTATTSFGGGDSGSVRDTEVSEKRDVSQFERNDPPDLSDDDNTSYRELVNGKDFDNSVSNIAMRSSGSNDTTWNHEADALGPSPIRRDSSPDYAVIMKRQSIGGRRDSLAIVTDADASSVAQAMASSGPPTPPLPPPPPSPPQQKPVSPTPAKPKRRFNSFLALVREVVTVKKQDSLPEVAEAESAIQSEPVEPESTVAPRRRDSTSAGHRHSLRRKSRGRQDSQTSIWSDNIPVITISKTESDECILEDRAPRNGNVEKSMPEVEECNNLDVQSD